MIEAFSCWPATAGVLKLAGGNLIVLHLQLVDDVDRRQVIFIQQIAIKPHAHRVLGAKQLHIANAIETANRILDV